MCRTRARSSTAPDRVPAASTTTSDSFKTGRPRAAYAARMTARFNAIGLVVADLAGSLAFYRRLGLDIPAEAD
ncbi:hypothetical protein ABZ554_42425, partial [Streptomyces sp. NPDC020125]